MADESNPLPERSPELSALFAAYESETARSPAQVESALEAVATKTAAAGVASSATGLSATLKMTIVAVAVAAGGAAVWGLSAADSGDPAPSPVVVAERSEPEPVVEVPVEPPPEVVDSEPPAPEIQPSVEAAPSEANEATLKGGPKSAPTKKPRHSAAKSVDAKPTPSLSAELELLNQARAALRSGKARRALDLVRKHRKAHGKSTFAEERDATEVVALCKLGRDDDAKKRATRFRKAFPGSSRDVLAACD